MLPQHVTVSPGVVFHSSRPKAGLEPEPNLKYNYSCFNSQSSVSYPGGKSSSVAGLESGATYLQDYEYQIRLYKSHTQVNWA